MLTIKSYCGNDTSLSLNVNCFNKTKAHITS